MKTLLLNPHVPLSKFYGKYARFGAVLPPYGMACVAAYMREKGQDVTLVDANRGEMHNDAVAAMALEMQPDIIGLYATTLGVEYAIKLATVLKEKLPKSTKFILGGPHAIGERGNVLKSNSVFDYSCLGEGEICFQQLVETLSSGETDLSKVSGLVWRRDGEVVENPIIEVLNLDDLPNPFKELDTFDNYRQKAFAYRKTPFAMVQTVRGCPFKCIFCSSPGYLKSIQGGRLRYHSLEWLEEQLDYLVYERGVREVYFVDDTFNCKKRRVFEICELIERKYPDLIWSCNFEVKISSKEMLQTMQRAGCWSIMIGAESGNQKILDGLQKNIKVEQIIQVADWCHEIGLMGRASFILGHPGETPETLRSTIELAKRVRLPFVSFSLMTPFAGTHMFEIAADTGEWEYQSEKTTLSKVSYVPHGISEELLIETYKNAYREVYGSMKRNLLLLHFLKKLANWDFAIKTFFRLFRPMQKPKQGHVNSNNSSLSVALQEKL